MKQHPVYGFLKWLLLFALLLWALFFSMTAIHPEKTVFSSLNSSSSLICRFIWNMMPEGLSSAQAMQQLASAGMSYMLPRPPILSAADWMYSFPKHLLTSHFQVFAATENPNLPVPPDTNAPTEPAALLPVLSENDGTEVNIQDFLREHTAQPVMNPQSVPAVMDGTKKIFLYCTHNSESYTPSSGGTHVEGGQGLINQVAEHLAQHLTQEGLPAEFIFAVHDWPSYDNSYTESRKTVHQILEGNSGNMLALFDVHRDSIASQKTADTVTVNRKKAARILLVVGTDQRKPHPNWQQNLALAQKIEAVGNTLYPGLIRGITQKAGTYHQELFTGALLLEFGTDLNSLEEACYAAELLSDILAEVLK